MRCNKHILKESSKGKKLKGGILSYVNYEIKGDSHENIASSIVNIRKTRLVLAHKINIILI